MSAGPLRIARASFVHIIAGMVDEYGDGFIPRRSLCDSVAGCVKIIAAHVLKKTDCFMRSKALVVLRPDVDVVLSACIAQHPDAEVIPAALREISRFVSVFSTAIEEHGYTTRLKTAKADTQALRQAIKNSRVSVARRPPSLGIVVVVTFSIQ